MCGDQSSVLLYCRRKVCVHLKVLESLFFKYWDDGRDWANAPRNVLLPATDPLAC